MGYTKHLFKYLRKAEAKKKDPLATKESMTVLHNVEARRQEHDALKREQGFPEEQDPNAMRYQRFSEMETDEQGKIMHNKPPWVVNEASEMIAEINDEDAPTYKKSDKAQNRAGKNTASLTKDWNPFKRGPSEEDLRNKRNQEMDTAQEQDRLKANKDFWDNPENRAMGQSIVDAHDAKKTPDRTPGESSLGGGFSTAPDLKEKYSDDKFLQGLPTTAKNLPKAPEQKAVTKSLTGSEGQNYGGVIAPERYEIVEKETLEERDKRKSGTGIAPTQIPDSWGTIDTRHSEEGKQTRSKPQLRRDADEENLSDADMEKGLGDVARKVGRGVKNLRPSYDREEGYNRVTFPRRTRFTEETQANYDKQKASNEEAIERGAATKESYSPRQAKRFGGVIGVGHDDDAAGLASEPKGEYIPLSDTGSYSGQARRQVVEDVLGSGRHKGGSGRGGNPKYERPTSASPETKQRVKAAGLEYAPKADMGKLTKALIKLYKAHEPGHSEELKRKGSALRAEGQQLASRAFSTPEQLENKKRELMQRLTGNVVPPIPSSNGTENMEKGRFGGTPGAFGREMTSEEKGATPSEEGEIPEFIKVIHPETGEEVTIRNPKREQIRGQVASGVGEVPYDPKGASGQMIRSPGDIRGEGSKKKKQMINNYIASLNKAVGLGGSKGHELAGGGSIYEHPYQPSPGEEEEWKERGIREFTLEYDEKTGKELIPTNVENFLPALGALAGTAAKKAGKAALLGGGDDDDGGGIEMTEKAHFGSGGHAREQQRRFNRMPSGQKKRYGGMGAMGFSPSKPKSKKEKK